MTHRPIAMTLAAAALAACTTPPPPQPPGTGTAAPVTTAAPTAAPTTTAAATAAPAEPASPFHPVAEMTGELNLAVAGGATYAYGWGILGEVTGQGIAPIGKGREELPQWGFPGFIAGGGGKTLLSFQTDNGRVGYSVLYERAGAGWKEIKTLPYGTMYAGLGAWKGGAVLASTLGAGMQLVLSKPAFTVVSGPRGGEPRLPKGDKTCAARMFPTSMLTFETGEVMALGANCQPEEGSSYGIPGQKAVIVRWEAGKQDGTVTELPVQLENIDLGFQAGQLIGRAPNDIWIASGTGRDSFFFHFDGSAYTKVEGAPAPAPTSMSAASDGTLYAVFGTDLHRRTPAGAWEKMPLPAGHRASSVLVNGADVWLVTQTGAVAKTPAEQTLALLHLGPPPAAVQKVAPPDKAPPAYKILKPVTSSCKTLFVMLYAFTKVTPPDYDFPLTRKALKGKLRYNKARFVVTEDGGRKYFGAFVPDIATGRDLTALIEKEVNGAKPAFVCSDPTVVSEFKLDLGTGERVK